jgi:hypothetical protein
VDREPFHLLGAEAGRLAGGAEVGAEVDRDDAVALLLQPGVGLGEVARAGRAGGGQARRRLELAEELVVGQVDAVAKGLLAEEDLERDDLDRVLLPPLRGEVGGGVGDDPELRCRQGCYSTLRMNG